MRLYALKQILTFVAAGVSLNGSMSVAVAAPVANGGRGPPAIMGDDGAKMVDRVISKLTPPCPHFSSGDEVSAWGQQVRQQVLADARIDLQRRVRKVEILRSLPGPKFRIDVARAEVFDGILMPLNIYVPNTPTEGGMPLVIAPTGCGSALWDMQAQRRAANLALLGMTVIVTEGFCGNGMRASQLESRRSVGYARQMLGLQGVAFSAYLQELVATLTWALETVPDVDAGRVGAVGHSYGGQVAMMLAQLDTRIASVAVGATYLGEPCDGFPLKSDIKMEGLRPQHMWLAPLEVPVLPTNWRLLTVFPRAVQTASGEADLSAPPHVIGGAMAYAREVYSLAGLADRVSYVTDRGNHNYNPQRRKDVYAWLTHTLLGRALENIPEQATPLRAWESLAPDISRSKSFFTELEQKIARDWKDRLESPDPVVTRERVAAEMHTLFDPHRPRPCARRPSINTRATTSLSKGCASKAICCPSPRLSSEENHHRQGRVALPFEQRHARRECDNPGNARALRSRHQHRRSRRRRARERSTPTAYLCSLPHAQPALTATSERRPVAQLPRGDPKGAHRHLGDRLGNVVLCRELEMASARTRRQGVSAGRSRQ